MRKPSLFLKCHPRVKDGKEHRYWSICENRRTQEGRRFQRQVISLGEINDSQKANWIKQIKVFDTAHDAPRTLALFPEDRLGPSEVAPAVQIRLSEFEICRPRPWGACWLALWLWNLLKLDEFWTQRLEPSREGTQWQLILKALSVYRWIDPGSEWRLHRQWFDSTALSGLLGPEFQLGCKENLYRTLDKWIEHKLQRIWIMDRGIPTEETLEKMRQSQPPVQYLVGTPKGRLRRLEKKLAEQPWGQAREKVQVKLHPQDNELFVLVESQDRLQKERAMRQGRLRRYWNRLQEISRMKDLSRDDLLKKLGAAQAEAGRAQGLVRVQVPAEGQAVGPETFTFKLDRKKLRQWRRREGRYLLRSNLTAQKSSELWEMYLMLVEIEAAFKNLKGDLRIRPVFHSKESRVEAHIFVAFLSYCLHVTLRRKLHASAPGLTPRAVLEQFVGMQMMDVHFPTTDGRRLIFRRYTKPEPDQAMILQQLNLELPPQAPPQITSQGKLIMT